MTNETIKRDFNSIVDADYRRNIGKFPTNLHEAISIPAADHRPWTTKARVAVRLRSNSTWSTEQPLMKSPRSGRSGKVAPWSAATATRSFDSKSPPTAFQNPGGVHQRRAKSASNGISSTINIYARPFGSYDEDDVHPSKPPVAVKVVGSRSAGRNSPGYSATPSSTIGWASSSPVPTQAPPAGNREGPVDG